MYEKLKGLPTLFCLSGSPFQALCMIEAILSFDIRDYKVLLCLSETELPRKAQLIELLNSYRISYEIESINYHITKKARFQVLLPRCNQYKLAFIGDCNNELLIFKAFQYVSDGGHLIYLDDGIATIQFFNGLCQLDRRLKYYYDVVCKVRHINFDKYFYTIYHDLKDGKHLCIANNFDYLAKLQQSKENISHVLLLGTCTNDYCYAEQIGTDVFMSELKKIMIELKQKYPHEDIIYVPHGRDTYHEPERFCHELGIVYQPTSISVEMFLLNAVYRPLAVYGFTSSALYNLNIFFPDTSVYNITFSGNTPLNDRINISSIYFIKHGIRRNERNIKL